MARINPPVPSPFVAADNDHAFNGHPFVADDDASPLPSFTYQGMTFSIEEIDPATATRWLEEYNTHNRKLRTAKSTTYAWDMANDNWSFNGDPFRFDIDGVLIDGQHRAAAIVESGTVQTALVIRGLPPEAQDTMDSGAVRKTRDVLTLRGEINTSQLASIARRVVALKHAMAGENRWAPTRREILDFIDADKPGMHRAVEVALQATGAKLPVAPSVIGTAFYLCAQKDAEAAEEFFVTKLIRSVSLIEDEPVYTLLRKITTTPLTPDQVFRYTVLAWNRHRAGVTRLSKLQSPHGGWPPYTELHID